MSIGAFTLGVIQLQDFQIPDVMFRAAQIGIALGVLLTIRFSIPVVQNRLKQRTYVKAFSALTVAFAQVLIVLYLTMFNFWSVNLMFQETGLHLELVLSDSS